MIQNHLLQVMATIAMEPSASFRADCRARRARQAAALHPHHEARRGARDNAVPGQYGPARIGGEDVPGFRQEKGVDPNSQTDTYAAVTFFVDNWRWAGVPFYIRTGKRLPKRVSEIAIQFNAAPLADLRQMTTAPAARPICSSCASSPRRASRSNSFPSGPARE